MANYANALVDPNQYQQQSVNNFMNAMQIKQAGQRNELAAQAGAREQQMSDLEMMAVPIKFTQMKAQHISQIAKNISGLPEKQRSAKYADLVNKVAPAPMTTHPQLGPLGVVDSKDFVAPEEFVNMTDEQQKEYLEVLSYTSSELAKIKLSDKEALNKEKQVLLESKEKMAQIREKGKIDMAIWGQKGQNALALENEKQEGAKESLGDFTKEEIDLMGATYNLKGTLPSLGMGKDATTIRRAILKSAASQAIGSGKNASELVGGQTDIKAIGQSIGQQEKQMGAMGSFVRNLDAQVDKVKELSKELSSFDTRLLNIPLRAVRGKLAGSAEQAKYDMYLTEIESEIGKLATGSSASVAELSIGAQEKWARIHDKNLSLKDMISLLEETKNAGKMRMKSVEDQLKESRKRQRSVGATPAPEQITAAPQDVVPGPQTAEDYLKKFGGR